MKILSIIIGKLTCFAGKIVHRGSVSDYIYPEDNEPEGVAGICIEDCPQRPGDWIGFNEHDIKEIKISSH